MKTKRTPVPKPKRRTPKPDDPAQSKRFVETAREIEADETGEAFRRALEKIVPPKAPIPKDGPQDGS
jgi:hypothetical protein